MLGSNLDLLNLFSFQLDSQVILCTELVSGSVQGALKIDSPEIEISLGHL